MAATKISLSEPQLAAVPDGWDAWLATESSQAGYCQSTMWAEINRAANNVDNHWVEIRHNGERVAGALLSRRRPNWENMKAAQRFKTKLSGAGAGSLDCFQGPILTGSNKRNLLTELLARVDVLAKELRIHEIRFHGPPATGDWLQDEEVLEIFLDYKYRRIANLTSLVDLTPAENKIFASFKRAARKGTRKCEEGGVRIFQCQSRESFLEDFCTPYYDDVDTPPNPNRNLATWDIDGGRHYRFFVAKDAQGRVLATLGSYSFNGLATEVMSHRTKASFDENLPAQDLLHWHVFKAHKAAGEHLFNLAGYSPNPETEKAAGIRRFKEKWGGREVSVPIFTKNYPSLPLRIWHGVSRRK